MNYLVDTNVILRLKQPQHPMNSYAVAAVETLKKQKNNLCIFPQNLIEFWVVATRPVDVNGLGLSFDVAILEIEKLKNIFSILLDIPSVYAEWEKLIKKYRVMGKQGHDTRLVAAMIAHKIDYVLTFNTDDFKRYSEVKAIAPSDVRGMRNGTEK